MTMPNVHKCGLLFAENDKLKTKVKKYSGKNKDLIAELNSVRDRLKADEILKQNRSSKCESTQTEVQKTLTGLPITVRYQARNSSRPSTSEEKQRADKLLQMHNNLMKRYEKEVKLNAEHADTIDKLNLRISEQEKFMTMTKSRLHDSEKENERLRTSRRPRSRSGSRGRSGSPSDSDDVRRERNELRTENCRLKKELSGLDKNFFDELEDLKFGLQQSAKLNQEYEKTLKSLCKKFNVPFPHSEMKTEPSSLPR